MEIKTFNNQKYQVTDDINDLHSEKINEGDLVFFNKNAEACYTSKKEDANDLLTVDYCSSDTIQFKELPNRTFDFFYRRFEMYLVVKKLN